MGLNHKAVKIDQGELANTGSSHRLGVDVYWLRKIQVDSRFKARH